MNPLRLVIITRRFWPFSGLVELAVGDLASELKRQGHDVEILTACWEKNWPKFFVTREVPVFRLAKPGSHPWGSHRFQKAVLQHIDRSFEEDRPIDAVIVFGLGQEIETLLKHVEKNEYATKILARIDNDLEPYHRWSQISNRKTLNCLGRTAAVIADSECTVKNLIRFVDKETIHMIPDGVESVTTNRSSLEQARARQALSDAHPILAIEPDQPLIVSAAAMDNDGGLVDLISAWPDVLRAYPRAKLWLLGDGTHGQQVWNTITAKNLVHSVIMPGYFDDLETVWSAADLYVHPYRFESGCSGLLRAMANKLCPVATENAFTRELVESDKTGILVPGSNPTAIAKAIEYALGNADLRKWLGHEASKRVIEKFAIAEHAKRYIGLATPAKLKIKPPHIPQSSQKGQTTQ